MRTGSDGEEARVATLANGDFFGEAALLTDASRDATVRALGPVRAVRVGRSDFESLAALPDFRRSMEEIRRARG